MESVRAQRWDGDEAEEADELGWRDAVEGVLDRPRVIAIGVGRRFCSRRGLQHRSGIINSHLFVLCSFMHQFSSIFSAPGNRYIKPNNTQSLPSGIFILKGELDTSTDI